jgi:predicted ATPase
VIASVAFRNFKVLRKTRLPLAPFNLVIGPNGSGKTSLIRALLRLRSLAKLPLAVVAESEKKKGGAQIEFNFAPPHEGMQVRLSCVSEFVCDLLQVVPADAPGWPALRAELGRIRSYLLDPHAMAAPAARKDGAVLVSNGANLAAVLAEMRDREPAAFGALTAEARRLMPEFAGIELADCDGGTVELGLRLADGGLVTAGDLSQGALYLLAVLALTLDPTPPSVLCIEEIARGVHPRMLREVRDAFYRLSYPQSSGLARNPVQVIATTHSPYLLDLFREHPEEIVITQKHGQEARFERLSDRADLPELLREGSLGDMWFSGILGGVPEEE